MQWNLMKTEGCKNENVVKLFGNNLKTHCWVPKDPSDPRLDQAGTENVWMDNKGLIGDQMNSKLLIT